MADAKIAKGIPIYLKCPITGTFFADPVVTCDGHTYERAAIEQWFRRKWTSPVTNKALASDRLVPSVITRQLIGFVMEHKGLGRQGKAAWHVATGLSQFRGSLPGGLAAAQKHFARAAEAGDTDAPVYLEAIALNDKAGHLGLDVGSFLASQDRHKKQRNRSRNSTAAAWTDDDETSGDSDIVWHPHWFGPAEETQTRFTTG